MSALDDLNQQIAYLNDAVASVCKLLDEEGYDYVQHTVSIFQILSIPEEGVSYVFSYLAYTNQFQTKVYATSNRAGMFPPDTLFTYDNKRRAITTTITVSAGKPEDLYDSVLPYLPGHTAPSEVQEHLKKIREVTAELKNALDSEDTDSIDGLFETAFQVHSDFASACQRNLFEEKFAGNAPVLLLEQIDRILRIEGEE